MVASVVLAAIALSVILAVRLETGGHGVDLAPHQASGRLVAFEWLAGLAAAAVVLLSILPLSIGPVASAAPSPAIRPAIRAAVSAPATGRWRPHTPTSVPVPIPSAAVSAAPPPAAPAPAAAPVVAAPAAASPVAPAPVADTPDAMGAEALALVRYPWQQIPGYTITFEPSSDAPGPGYYGNTWVNWGQPQGGHTSIYVYPGESITWLAGVIAFEIGHEVDAGYVEPQGGHTQIENLLGIYPASWYPDCDCAEQGYLSGWYSAAFSNYWSPGVGDWATIAPAPAGATLTALQPWLDPPRG